MMPVCADPWNRWRGEYADPRTYQSRQRALPARSVDAGGIGGFGCCASCIVGIPNLHYRSRAPSGRRYSQHHRSAECAIENYWRRAGKTEFDFEKARERRGAGAQPIPEHLDRAQGHQLVEDLCRPGEGAAVQRTSGVGPLTGGGFRERGPAGYAGGCERSAAGARTVAQARSLAPVRTAGSSQLDAAFSNRPVFSVSREREICPEILA